MPSRDREATQAGIRSAALRLFTERGYAGTPLRDIASEAGVDPAMIIRYFSSKEELFLDTMKLDEEHYAILDGPLDELGEHFVEFVLDSADQVRAMFLALVQASGNEGVGSRLSEAHEEFFVAPLRRRLSGDDAELRARLAASLVGGLLYSLWVVGDEHLLATDRRELVRRYGALLQELVTPR